MSTIKICPICEYPITKKRDDLFCSDVCKQKDFRKKRNNFYDQELSEKELSINNIKNIRKSLEFRFYILKIRYENDINKWLKTQQEKGIEVNKENEKVWWEYCILKCKIGVLEISKQHYDSIKDEEFDFDEFKHLITNKPF